MPAENSNSSFVYALIRVDEGSKAGKPDGEIKVMFNPKELTIAKSVQWQQRQQGGKNTQGLEFSSGQPASLKLELVFDTLEEHPNAGGAKDVRELTQKVHNLMLVDEQLKKKKSDKGRPAAVLFIWKSFKFKGYVQSVNEKVSLFKPDGTALRATLEVSFVQAKDETMLNPQNPTSGGEGGERLHTVQQGENLALIAYRLTGDTHMWRRIAEINNLEHTRRLQPGTVLVIPNA